MKKNKKKFIIGIILIIVILVIIYFLIHGKNLDTNSTLINEIYTYIGSNDLEICSGLNTYSDKTVSFDDLENSNRICIAYSLIDTDNATTLKIDKSKKENTCSINENIVFATDNYEDEICTVSKFEAQLIDEQYNKIFGKNIDNYESFQFDNKTVCFYDDGYYYCGLSETYTYTIGAEPHTYRSIKNAVKKGDEIIIYDYFLKIVNDECYTTYTVDTKNNKCTDNYETNNEIDYKFLKKYGTLYKHTYKKDGDNYYWVKSEPAN